MTSDIELSHRRMDLLTGQWVLVSPQRSKRPWQGEQLRTTNETRQPHEPTCYLCPGNIRASGQANPDYDTTFVFDNDYPALLSCQRHKRVCSTGDNLLRQESVDGSCRVICFSPRHDLTLPQLSLGAITCVIDLWAQETLELSKHYKWVQVFENKGSLMGCSNPHPHNQIWASNRVPTIPALEDANQDSYKKATGNPLLLDYLARELKLQERIVAESEHWVSLVPFWATWPFETLLLPRSHVRRLPELSEVQRSDLAMILKRVLTRYDNLFQTPFPYSMGWHGAPFNTTHDTSHWQLHAHFFPPLLRSASVKKFMVGYEMLSEPQRDLTPEQAASRLQNLSDLHYLCSEDSTT